MANLDEIYQKMIQAENARRQQQQLLERTRQEEIRRQNEKFRIDQIMYEQKLAFGLANCTAIIKSPQDCTQLYVECGYWEEDYEE